MKFTKKHSHKAIRFVLCQIKDSTGKTIKLWRNGECKCGERQVVGEWLK